MSVYYGISQAGSDISHCFIMHHVPIANNFAANNIAINIKSHMNRESLGTHSSLRKAQQCIATIKLLLH